MLYVYNWFQFFSSRSTRFGPIFPFNTIFRLCAGGADVTSSSCSDDDSSLIQAVVVVNLYHVRLGVTLLSLSYRCFIFNASDIIRLKCTVLSY